MNEYIESVLNAVKRRDPGEVKYYQAVEEVLSGISPVIDKRPEYRKKGILERIVEPEQVHGFRVVWMDDKGVTQVNRGYRVQFSSVLGPYKGGLRFAPQVDLSMMKFLGFEQTFKNCLTTLQMGGAKGGSDFDPSGKSDDEVMRFCQAFMTGLYRYIGADMDVPAGDIGVGGREIGYLFGQYKRIVGKFENGTLTGKNMAYGGSYIRPEATGYGAIYYLQEVLAHDGDGIEGKRIGISGYGNASWGVAKKVAELGGKVVTLAGRDGYIYDPDGVCTEEKLNFMLDMRASNSHGIKSYADKFGVEFFPGRKPWERKLDVCMPCACENEVDIFEAKQILSNGVKYYIEVSNMSTTNEALSLLRQNNVTVAPSKAVNAGGVAVSGLEMSQNSERQRWSAQKVDTKLKCIMTNIYNQSVNAAAKYGLGYDLVAGANIAAFETIADAMLSQGLV